MSATGRVMVVWVLLVALVGVLVVVGVNRLLDSGTGSGAVAVGSPIAPPADEAQDGFAPTSLGHGLLGRLGLWQGGALVVEDGVTYWQSSVLRRRFDFEGFLAVAQMSSPRGSWLALARNGQRVVVVCRRGRDEARLMVLADQASFVVAAVGVGGAG